MRFLKRFPEEKHEQIKQLMNYIQLRGVAGKDLVSIGGYIDRHRRSEQARIWIERVKSYDVKPVGKDSQYDITRRFKLKTADNKTYTFTNNGYGGFDWVIVSNSTNVRKMHSPECRDWPAHIKWSKAHYYNIVLDVSDGIFKLDF